MNTVFRLYRHNRRCGYSLGYSLRRAIRTVLRDFNLNRRIP